LHWDIVLKFAHINFLYSSYWLVDFEAELDVSDEQLVVRPAFHAWESSAVLHT
jgi:hypothetical protein